MNSYTKTKQFTEWLDKVKPEFEIKSDYCYVSNLLNEKKKNGPQKKSYARITKWDKRLCEFIDTDTLRSILWELFYDGDVYSVNKWLDKYFHFMRITNQSLWQEDPDSVLADIMKVYNEMNR